ncbi:MAG: DsbC family protein [Rhodanobacteraceae bacterium]|nr:DsbC family protein [Xanthomonadales bacterium]MCP5479483.1 DsbC family protein [Rhodanobacteraceae bacterium]HPF73839.1 DsbC family protein [Xanthomonadaceae bacterium]HRY00123.1 DsbC family protein [Xanthomonadaceae bacterium]
MSRFLIGALIGVISCAAIAGDATSAKEEKIRAAIQSLVPGATIDSIADAVIPGLVEVQVSGQVAYVSEDGKYLFQGSIYDINGKKDLTEASRAEVRQTALKDFGKDKRIIFSPANPKHTVTVFTDIDCGYCRKLHDQIADYNAQGIAIEYMFFPRAGVGSASFDKAVDVWCAADRRDALTEAKAGGEPVKAECPNPVEAEYALGQRIGVNGTPAIFTADGTQIGGYVPPEQMRARLDQLEGTGASKP